MFRRRAAGTASRIRAGDLASAPWSREAHTISVSTDTGLSQTRRVTITMKSLFN